MARYEITGPDGGRYEITAPDHASQEDILGYVQQQIASNDTSRQPLDPRAARFSPKVPDAPGLGEDMAKGFASGVAKGAIGLASLPGSLETLGRAGINAAGRQFGAKDNLVAPEPYNATYDTVKRLTENHLTGPLYDPQTRLGKVAGAVGEFAPGMLFPAGGAANMTAQLGARAMRNVLAPGVASEVAGQLTEGTKAEPWARIGGAMLGPTAVTPFAAQPVRNQMVQTLRNEGVTAMTAGQETGRRPLRWVESAIQDTPFTGTRGAQLNTQAAEQFTAAALRRAGIDAPRATTDVMDQAFQRIGAVFDQVTQNNRMNVTRPVQIQTLRALQEYERMTPPAQQIPLVRAIADDIFNAGQRPNAVISGETYQGWRSAIQRAERGTGDPQARAALAEMRNTLDNAFESGLQGREAQAFREARRQYRNILVIEKAAAGAGEAAAEGLISPSSLRNAVTVANQRDYVRGRGDFADLARAGEAILKPLPQSGTAPRLAAQEMGKMAAGAAIGGSTYGGPEGAAAGGVAPFLMQAAMGRAVMSRPAQAYLRNQLAAGPAIGIGANRALVTAPSTVTEAAQAVGPEMPLPDDYPGLYGVVRPSRR